MGHRKGSIADIVNPFNTYSACTLDGTTIKILQCAFSQNIDGKTDS